MKQYNVLLIGNSFSNNLITFLVQLAKQVDIKLNIGNLYYGGCTVDKHYNFITTKQPVYEISTYDFEKDELVTEICKTFDKLVDLEKWDIVTLQQNSLWSGCCHCEKYVPEWQHLGELINLVRDRVGDHAKFYWNMVWSFENGFDGYGGGLEEFYKGSSDYMYQSIIDTYKEMIGSRKEFAGFNPFGTAIQSARHLNICSLSDDGLHVNAKGCVIIGLVFLKSVFGVDIDDININEITQHCRRYEYEEVKTGDNYVAITDEEAKAFKKCVNWAIEHPFEAL